ncbi:hypothetical protein HQQ80_07840 [Microbacteriaceae bacterium VKM Ac-2855]|nr:hypothetical protein [Microbacteriaceae bacterium VKM Ac-2855]
MKTLTYLGGTVSVADETADAVMGYALALATRHRTDTVTLNTGDDHISGRTVFLVGLGIPLSSSQQGPGTLATVDSADELCRRTSMLAGRVASVSVAATVHERSIIDLDFDFDIDDFS